MTSVRKIVFWVHLVAGVVAGSVVLIMSVTGVLLTYERQMLAWADGISAPVAPHAPGTPRVSFDSMVAVASGVRQGAASGIVVRADPDAPVAVAFGRADPELVDPYTGKALGPGTTNPRRIFRVVTDWHRWLGRSDDGRAVGRAITGASNLAFLVLVLTGAYLWLPRRWTRTQVRNVAWFRRGLSGKARDFNWHNVIGLWMVVPLVIVVASGVVISYGWAGRLVYRVVGERPPARTAGPSGPGGTGGGGPASRGAPSTAGVELALASAARQVPGWRTITVPLAPATIDSLTVSIDAGTGGQPQKRGSLVVDRATGDVRRWEPFGSQLASRRLRSLLRFSHTGEVGGLAGQTIAGLASLGAVVLVWTGLALAWRRFRAWRARGAEARVADEARAAA